MLQKTPERRRNNNKELCVDGAIHQNNNGLRNPSVKKGIQNNNMSFPVPCKNKPKVYGYSRVFCPGNVSVVLERLNATRNKISRHSGKNKSQQGGAVSTPYVRTSNRGLGLPEKGHIQSAWMFFKTNNKPKSCTVHTYSKKKSENNFVGKNPNNNHLFVRVPLVCTPRDTSEEKTRRPNLGVPQPTEPPTKTGRQRRQNAERREASTHTHTQWTKISTDTKHRPTRNTN